MAAENPSYYQRFPVNQQIQQTEHVFHLYMYQIWDPALPDSNQKMILFPGLPDNFGLLTATDWIIRDVLSPGHPIVARAQGLALGADMSAFRYLVCQNIMFTDARFKGSSLKILGNYIDSEDGEWAVIGGSGEFSYAQGAIKYKVISTSNKSIVRELNIRVLCQDMPTPVPPSPVEKDGPAMGGNGGDEFDVEAPQRLESVTIRSGNVIDSIAFSYIDTTGRKQTAGPWGGNGGLPKTIVFAPTETVTKVYGTTNNFGGHVVVTSLTIDTNLTTYETLGKGKGNGTPFSLPRKDGQNVTGFFGRAGLFLYALGVYTT